MVVVWGALSGKREYFLSSLVLCVCVYYSSVTWDGLGRLVLARDNSG